MKAVIASLVTAVIVASGAGAYVEVVTPAQFARLNARVTALETFKRECLLRIRLSETSQGWMAWNQPQTVPISPHSGVFYGLPDTVGGARFC